MPRKALALFDGVAGGVNTMLNVINTKQAIEERKFQRGRLKRFDEISEEERVRRHGREDQQDRYTLDDRATATTDRLRLHRRQDIVDENRDEDRTIAATDRTRQYGRQDRADARSESTFNQQSRINEVNLSNLQGEDRQRRLTESYNLLRAFNSMAQDGEGGDIDPQSVLSSLNYFLGDRLNQGGEKGTSKRISDVYPSPDGEGLLVELDVQPPSGDSYRAPLTLNRTSDKDDQVAVVPYNDIFNLVYEVADDLSEAGFEGTIPEISAQLEEALRVASGDRSVETAAAESAKVQRLHLNRVAEEDNRQGNRLRLEQWKKDNGVGTGGSNREAQFIDYLQENMRGADGQPISFERAFELANQAKSNPADAVIRIYEQLSATNDSPFNSADKKTEDELLLEARRMVQSLSGFSLAPDLPVRQRLQLPVTGQQPAPERAGQGQTEPTAFEAMPPAADHKGRYLTDSDTGQRFYSDGVQWSEVQ